MNFPKEVTETGKVQITEKLAITVVKVAENGQQNIAERALLMYLLANGNS